GSLQACTLVASQSGWQAAFWLQFLPLRRQPVSPMMAIFSRLFGGRGSVVEPTETEEAPAGIGASQTRTSKHAWGAERAVIGCGEPSTISSGHEAPEPVTIARAIAPWE